MDFFNKYAENPYPDLLWNIPEGRKLGTVAIIGGNSQNFRTMSLIYEFLAKKFPLENIKMILPDALKTKLPTGQDFCFLKSTETGSFADKNELLGATSKLDFALFLGDWSKNSITREAVADTVLEIPNPAVLTRDTVDAISESARLGEILMRENLIILGSGLQWQRILKAVYYPKILQVSQPLMRVVEVFHKFTLSYQVTAVSFHDGQVLVARNGQVTAVPLEKTGMNTLTLWNGELAARIMALNLYNPNKFMDATVTAVFQ